MITLFESASLLGTLSFALSGFIVGVRKKLDLLGILIASLLTALGGGILRDILLLTPPTALIQTLPSLTVLSAIVGGFLFQVHKKEDLEQKGIFLVSDTIGLCAFSVAGAIAGIEAHYSLFGVILLAFITAVGGGILRDVILNDVPQILISEFYGTVAIVIAILLFIFHYFSIMNFISVSLVMILGITLRLIAYFRDWHLPKIT